MTNSSCLLLLLMPVLPRGLFLKCAYAYEGNPSSFCWCRSRTNAAILARALARIRPGMCVFLLPGSIHSFPLLFLFFFVWVCAEGDGEGRMPDEECLHCVPQLPSDISTTSLVESSKMTLHHVFRFGFVAFALGFPCLPYQGPSTCAPYHCWSDQQNSTRSPSEIAFGLSALSTSSGALDRCFGEGRFTLMSSLAAPTAAAAHSNSMFALLSAAGRLLLSAFSAFVSPSMLNEKCGTAELRLIAVTLFELLTE